MRRVVIIGTSGSGKTTLARRVAAALKAAHIELDALHWEPNWTETRTERMREKVRSAIASAQNGWVVCGNYRKLNDEIWPNADTIIWLDYSMSVVARRVFLRTMSRWWNRQELWSGNRERLTVQFFSRDSLFLWVINTWRIHRRDYPKELRSEKCRHLRVIRFRDPRAADAWIARLESSHAGDEQEQPNDSVAA